MKSTLDDQIRCIKGMLHMHQRQYNDGSAWVENAISALNSMQKGFSKTEKTAPALQTTAVDEKAPLIAGAAKYPPLETISRPNVNTEQAAYYLMRRPQTLRTWACKKIGPIQPVYTSGRLGWAVADIRKVLNDC
jgi:hypothetical protein